MRLMLAAAAAVMFAAPALPQDAEINYRDGALGYDALIAADYEKAEAQLLEANGVSRNDPARLINLGQVFAKTGRTTEASVMFNRAIKAQRITLVLADGSMMDSRDAARAALADLDQ